MAVIVILSVGVVIGLFLNRYDAVLRVANWLTQIVIFILLFVLGYSIGQNHAIFRNIETIGIKSFFFSLGTILGSILFVKLIWKKIF
ncbi:MAG TPA: DUF340 domain-containing protein [Firmicutes bacterium]|uniref:DUF340 domain-containing protein n=1 Tax=candidate division TA06 bacterium TaxID=2250710 RepID=A0A660S7R1_UNCT6|nr:LysO family transporter [candidate division WOR-3 bacterium]RKX66153.1 MAG: hypothetical protein DRP44_04755 [candidate division TA06 bacterium]HFD04817.1 DUF340 domain-containing protein [Bacillota bacterium]